MALSPRMLVRLMDRLKAGEHVASMGYPDILVSIERLSDWVDTQGLKTREDSESICKRHGMSPTPIADAEHLFERKGASLDVFDVVRERGSEILCDLNQPIAPQACGEYDYVLDVGTLEHCFNVVQAVVNMSRLVKVGGCVMHENPFNWGNHGFYSLHPTFYQDFYEANGFEVEEMVLLPKDRDCVWEWEPPRTKRFGWDEGEVIMFVIAKKVEDVDLTFPMQSKYRRH